MMKTGLGPSPDSVMRIRPVTPFSATANDTSSRNKVPMALFKHNSPGRGYRKNAQNVSPLVLVGIPYGIVISLPPVFFLSLVRSTTTYYAEETASNTTNALECL